MFCSLLSGQRDLPIGLLHLACGASCIDNDEFVLVLEDCQGFG